MTNFHIFRIVEKDSFYNTNITSIKNDETSDPDFSGMLHLSAYG